MKKLLLSFLVLSTLLYPDAKSQMITGVWKGKINRQKAEVKIILNGDSLTGTSYYYESATNYRRYSIKGYFDANTNEAIWWDDQLIEERSGKYSVSTPGRIPLLSRADFNCPGGGKMMLDGKAGKVYEDQKLDGEVHLDKTEYGIFQDEWDFVIDNYLVGTNDPYIIDSIATLQTLPFRQQKETGTSQAAVPPDEKPIIKNDAPAEEIKPLAKASEPVKPQAKMESGPSISIPVTVAPKVPTIEEKFINRKKILTTEIPVSGDSVELRFYDNAEIDGDSISLFLNDKLIFQHIRLLGSAYVIKLAVSELNATNELIMVAENLGSIPPNTSYMVALVADKRYEARLESTEGSSAMVRFVKK